MDISIYDNVNNALPKYYLVKHTILNWIKTGKLAGNDMLPTENELMKTFSVSRITIRRALSELTDSKYIYRIQGKGTFVNSNRQASMLNASKVEGYADLIEHSGMVPRRKCIRNEMISCEKDDAEILNLNAGDSVYALERVYFADDIPAIYACSVINPKVLKGIENYDISANSILKVITECLGLKIQTKGRSIVITLADKKLSEVLKVPENFPLLLLRYYSVMSGNGDPWESARSYIRTDVLDYLPDLPI